MKTKNQQPYSSELDAKEKLIVYVYEYLIHSGAKQAAETFKENIGYAKEIKVNEGPGFLSDWWCVFWDLYCAAPERRHNLPESSSDARAFHDFMSPAITQTSPPQQHPGQPPPQQQPGPMPPQFMVGPPRYGPPMAGQPRGPPPPRMQGPPQQQQQQHGPPPPHPGGPPPGGFMPVGSPRYAQGPPPPPQHINQGPPGPMFVGHGGPDPQMGPSPNMNRMTPVGGPPPPLAQQQHPPPPQQQQVVGQQMIGLGGPGGPPPPQQQPPSHADEYVMPVPFGQPETGDQCESAEILKLKQSMQEDTTRMFESEQSEFSLNDYSDSQNI